MDDRVTKIREISKKLLGDKKVELIIGYKKGTIPFKNMPFIARTSQEVEQLVWDSSCTSNLANFLRDYKNIPVGIVAQGCVSRNIVGLIIENQVIRENVYIIGVPCYAMVDRSQALNKAGFEVLESSEDNAKFTLKGRSKEIILDKSEILRNNCKLCIHRNPQLFDELIGNAVIEQKIPNRYEEIEQIKSMSPEQRMEFFNDLFKECLRCNSCRDVCPLCYCKECFVEKSTPQWCGKSQDSRDVLSFQMIKAYHGAGRCTDCGACEDICPMGIKLRLLSRQINKDIYDNYGEFEAGLSLDAQPPMSCYALNDPEPCKTKGRDS